MAAECGFCGRLVKHDDDCKVLKRKLEKMKDEAMSEGKHTPNELSLGLESDELSSQIIDTDGWHIARVEGPKHKERAELFAKAPDMALELERLRAVNAELLEACIEVLSLWDNVPEVHEYVGTYEVLTNAIAKSEDRA